MKTMSVSFNMDNNEHIQALEPFEFVEKAYDLEQMESIERILPPGYTLVVLDVGSDGLFLRSVKTVRLAHLLKFLKETFKTSRK